MSKEIVEKHLKEFFSYLEISPELEIEQIDEGFSIKITGRNLNFLIGYRGESLDALQYLVTQTIYRENNTWTPINIDINGYKQKKLEKIEESVKDIVDRVRFHQKEFVLPPLNSFERRHVHMLISDYIDVKSESRGEGPERRLYLMPVKE